MSSYLIQFWVEILNVFVLPGTFGSLTYYQSYGAVAADSTFALALNINQVASVLAFLTILGGCIFLFYQVYKLVHAFIGGFYEDAI